MEIDPSLSLLESLEAILDPSVPPVSNLSNAARVLFDRVHGVSWAGFYLVLKEEGVLYLGPYQGDLACTRIPFGKGVCGTAAATKETQLVPDVHAFPGHIACSSASRSELVVPLIKDGKVLGVIDLDSESLGNFSEQDARELERAASLLIRYL